MAADTIRLGIVGAGGRGASFKSACDAMPSVKIQAVCDVDEARARRVAEITGAPQIFTDRKSVV